MKMTEAEQAIVREIRKKGFRVEAFILRGEHHIDVWDDDRGRVVCQSNGVTLQGALEHAVAALSTYVASRSGSDGQPS